MAKDNNPNPNKFRISPWLVYTAILLIFLFISFVTGSSSLQEPALLKSSNIDNMLAKGEIKNVIDHPVLRMQTIVSNPDL